MRLGASRFATVWSKRQQQARMVAWIGAETNQRAEVLAVVSVINDQEFLSVTKLIQMVGCDFFSWRDEPNSKSTSSNVYPLNNVPQ